MNNKKSCFAFVYSMWLITASFSSTADLPRTIEKVRPGIVAIGTIMPTRSPKTKYTGTGFVVGDGRHVITNEHVIPKIINYARKESLAVFSGRGKHATARRAEVLATDEDHDLALLSITGNPLPALSIGFSSKVREGVQYAFTGFPIGMVLGLYPVTHVGIVSSLTPIVIPTTSVGKLTAKQIRRMRSPFEVYQLDAIAYPGNSGSPLYEVDTGKVIGVVNSVFVKGTKESVLSSPSGISYAIPVKYIKSLLNKNGVSSH